MKNRTGIDFSKHTHRVEIFKSEEGNEIRIDHFQVGKSYMEYIKFINTDNNLFVSGDFGCWTFDRPFIPSEKTNNVSDYYWLEKLQIATGQKIELYDSEKTAKLIEELIETGLEDCGYEGDRLIKLKEWYSDLLEYVGDEHEYIYHAHRDYSRPNYLDHEDIPFGTKLPIHLEIIFDAFEEICERLRNAPKPEIVEEEEVELIGVVAYNETDFEKWKNEKKFKTTGISKYNSFQVGNIKYQAIFNVNDLRGKGFHKIFETKKAMEKKDYNIIKQFIIYSIINETK